MCAFVIIYSTLPFELVKFQLKNITFFVFIVKNSNKKGERIIRAFVQNRDLRKKCLKFADAKFSEFQSTALGLVSDVHRIYLTNQTVDPDRWNTIGLLQRPT